MKNAIAHSSIEWAAQVAHVWEVSLLGTADLAYWQQRLGGTGLKVAELDGHAQLLIIAADMKFKGLRFRELSFSVVVNFEHEGSPCEGAYLLHAFNSCRLFAFVERRFFATPYYHGAVDVQISLPSVSLARHGELAFRAAMSAEVAGRPRTPTSLGDGGWEGPVFLPESHGANRGTGRAFIARLRGHTATFAFDASGDTLMIRPARGSEVLRALLDSRFAAREWQIRADATHAKSKTYARADAIERLL